MRALDRCLQLLEDQLADGKVRVDGPLGYRLRHLLGDGGLIPDHRLEGRKIDRVLDDIFALQARVLGQDDEQAAG
jgi:TolB-like protein